MALTLVDSPDTHTPCYNPQGFIFSSTNTAQANFTYHFILTINGIVITRDVDANPTDNLFYFDAQKNVESHCKNEFYPTILDFQFSLDGAISKVDWSVQEKYGTPPTLQGVATTGTYYVWNAAYKTIDFPSYDYTAYAASLRSLDLTLAPDLTDTINYDQKYLFKTWHRGFSSSDIRYLRLICYNNTGMIILQDAILENQFYNVGVLGYTKNYIILNCSPYGLNNISGAAIISQSQPGDLVPTGTAYYTLQFSDTNPSVLLTSNLYTVYIDDFCSRYDRYVLHFLNKLGNYDSFTFNMLSRETSENKQDSYKKFAARKIGSSYTYYPYDSDTVNYSTTITRRLLLNSDIITDAQIIWLDELLHSPSIYLETPDVQLIAVKLTNRGPFERKKKVNDKIFNLNIEVQYSFEDIRQRG